MQTQVLTLDQVPVLLPRVGLDWAVCPDHRADHEGHGKDPRPRNSTTANELF